MDVKKSPSNRRAKRSSAAAAGGSGATPAASSGGGGGSSGGGTGGAGSGGSTATGSGSKTGSQEQDNYWDCSVCTYRNTFDAFKCLMCDVRKGTSTRKPRINQVAQQLLNQQTPISVGTKAHHKRDKSEKKTNNERGPTSERRITNNRRNKIHHLRKLRNVDRNTAETREVTVNNVTVMITEYKPKPNTGHHHHMFLSSSSSSSLIGSGQQHSTGQHFHNSDSESAGSEAPSLADSDSRSSMEEKEVARAIRDIIRRGKKKKEENHALRKAETAEVQQLLLSQLSPEKSSTDKSPSKKTNTKEPLPLPLPKNFQIPFESPVINLIDCEKVNKLFNESHLSLERALSGCSDLFGYNVEHLINFDDFKEKILNFIDFLPDHQVPRDLILYFLYKLSITPDSDKRATDYLKFIKKFPVTLTPSDLIPLFVNCGVSSSLCQIPQFIECPPTPCVEIINKSNNLYRCVKLIRELIIEGNFKVDHCVRKLLKLLIKLSFDSNYRKTPLFSAFASVFDSIVITLPKSEHQKYANWTYQKQQDMFFNLDLCRIFLRPTTDIQQHAVALNLSNALEPPQDFDVPFEVNIFEKVLRLCNKKYKQISHPQLFCALELLLILLPAFQHFTKAKLSLISKQLDILDSKLISPIKDNPDLIRTRSSASKLRCMVVLRR